MSQCFTIYNLLSIFNLINSSTFSSHIFFSFSSPRKKNSNILASLVDLICSKTRVWDINIIPGNFDKEKRKKSVKFYFELNDRVRSSFSLSRFQRIKTILSRVGRRTPPPPFLSPKYLSWITENGLKYFLFTFEVL